MRTYITTVFGHYAYGAQATDGQTVKTRSLYQALVNRYTANTVGVYDTHSWKQRPLKLLWGCFKAAFSSKSVILLPAHNGVMVFIPLFYFLSLLLRFKVYYVVIGGWIIGMAGRKVLLRYALKRISGIYVETKTAKKELESMGFSNVKIMPNFKYIPEANIADLPHFYHEPLRLCTFSRVMQKKGIEDAIEAICKINEKYKRVVYELDIYGKIDDDYDVDFSRLMSESPIYVNYRGIIDYSQSYTALKDYYFLLFPTLFFTEGVPGTIVDAYAAGVPVIASKWESFSDIVDESITGYGYDFKNSDSLHLVLEECMNVEVGMSMKAACLEKAKLFTPISATKELFLNLDKLDKE